ncbi:MULTISPECIES: WD40/YVTN/BNR-like repeat-containing protein [Halorussus]|uniref:WD40/YVTN/BNR-like repeat-containing protein n=1 Tax=Halorussus TaxID=1070314 RepID=UPI00209FE8C6|nr:WD40 repeat domain-containing protein [Halorussus vallis]USZ76724.1 WD40 repeat domain-containing protein [Halorussus vallis]
MLLAGTGDGAYRIDELRATTETSATKVLDAPNVERVRQFDGVDGVFAATGAGLYHSSDGTEWTNLDVPRETVYAVGASPSGERIYAGTRPTHVFVSEPLPAASDGGLGPLEWRELDGFTDLPSREEWGVPRHDDVAQVRSLCTDPDAPNRVVAGVEPGGVHVSDDGGETWEERRDGVHDDIHELHCVSATEYVAATGVGLYHTEDAGRSWRRLDDEVPQRYFRASRLHDGVLYTSAACVPPNRWESDEANPALFECRDGRTLEAVDSPTPDEVVVGWTTVDGDLVGATHRGTLHRQQSGEWRAVGEVPNPDETLHGRYVNLTWYDPGRR